MRLGRICPDLDASLFFDPDEIRGAYLLTKERRPERPPTLNEMVRLIARVGGFLGRKAMATRASKRSGRAFRMFAWPRSRSRRYAKKLGNLCINL
jgi:hypothetical protein